MKYRYDQIRVRVPYLSTTHGLQSFSLLILNLLSEMLYFRWTTPDSLHQIFRSLFTPIYEIL